MGGRSGAKLDRRAFLLGGAGVVCAGLLGAPGSRAAAAAPQVHRYVPLGRTGMKISDISFGSSQSSDPKLVRYAFEHGVNYFDTAESYQGGASEQAIGEALHDVRDRIFLASKTKVGPRARRDELLGALEGSLRRLRTDHVDVYFHHAVNDVARLANEEWQAFTERAKQQGKIRFRGISGHAGRLVECLEYALDHQLVDVVLVAYNFGQDPAFYRKALARFDVVALQPELPGVLARAHREGVGTVAMKTLVGARVNDLRPYEREGGTFAQAAFRWVLSSPDLDALVVSMKQPDQIDEYLAASGTAPVKRSDLILLKRYAARNGGRYCQHGCDACHPSCPFGVEISEVLRTRMYDVDYRNPELARAGYAALGTAASACLGCDATPCAGACPNGIPISRFTRDAASRLGPALPHPTATA